MSQRALKRKLDRPALAYHYTAAVENLTGESIFVHDKLYSKFAVLEDDLRELGIPPRSYAYGVVKMLTPWAKKYGMRTVPATTFCSDWALNKFVKVFNADTVRAVTEEENDNTSLLQSELTVARLYIERNRVDFTRMLDVVEEVRELLSPAWIELYETRGRRPTMYALDILVAEYRISRIVNDYSDIVECLR